MSNVHLAGRSPQTINVIDWRLKIGRHTLERREALREDLAVAGPVGLLSLIEALIHEERPLDRGKLLGSVVPLCRPDVAAGAEELLDFFTGDDPRRHLWKLGKDGSYQLLGPHENLPN